MIRSKKLADQAADVYESGKEFAYDHVTHYRVVPINRASDEIVNINVNAQRRCMKAILLLFVEPYAAGNSSSPT